MGEKLHWIREAFSRKTVIFNGNESVGEMWQDSLFSLDVQARLNKVHVLFDVKGFLKCSVSIHDLNNGNKTVGVIHFHIGKKAKLVLSDGTTYVWRRQNFFMKEWSLIQQDGTDSSEILHYEQLRRFFADRGEVSGAYVDKQSELLILAGLFIGQYFRRKRRAAAAAS